MLVGIYQVIPFIVGVGFYYVMDLWLRHRFIPKRPIHEKRDWVFHVGGLIAIIFILIQPFIMPWLGLYTAEWWGLVLQGIGVGLFIGGIFLIGWVRFHLKHFFSEEIELQPGHRVVNTGPYLWVRHPLYSASFISLLGLVLINPSLIELLLFCFVLWHFSKRAKLEEALLIRELPGYKEYAAVTPPFIPRFWREKVKRNSELT
jgi:protein-S-isoprenylcysteine O-methyltransferase Ste14